MLRFVGNGDQQKIHRKSPPFFNAKFPGKFEENPHKFSGGPLHLITSPDLAEESKPSPVQKVKNESPGESLRESPRVLADPPKRVKNESPGDSASQKSPVF